MNEAKIDAELSLALDTNEAERARSLDLDVGYDAEDNVWELIVKYTGDLGFVSEELGAVITPLLNEYAIIRIKENLIGRLSDYPQIEFIEKPKNLVLSEMEGISASCLNPVRLPPFSLYGENMLIAIIDSGIDYSHPDFLTENGETRILELWDQSGQRSRPETENQAGEEPLSVTGYPPEGYEIGALYTRERINEALQADSREEGLRIVPEVDLSGHGTHVAGIACGNGRASGGRYVGVAPRAEMLVVKLGPPSERGFPRTSELMQAVDWCIRYALKANRPIAINISFGNNYGDHDGASLLERYIDSVSNLGRTVICIGAGNEGNTGRHLAGRISNALEVVEFTVAPFETGMNLQIWKEYADQFRVILETPSGVRVAAEEGKAVQAGEETDIRIIYALPTPYDTRQEVYIALIPMHTYIESGIWKVLLEPIRIRSGYYNMWLPVASATGVQTGFVRPSAELSLTIPGTSYRAITVGAYDSRTNSYAAFSGRGYEGSMVSGLQGDSQAVIYPPKPDITAPGVKITAAAPGGGYDTRSGTSMATPFVTGAAALLMEWGILNGNDPYLYGERLKAALIRGARTLPGFLYYPNAQIGWGALCVRDSI